MILFMLPVYPIAEVEQNLIVGRAVDLLATHFKVRPVCVAFAGTGYRLCLKFIGLASSALFRRWKLAGLKLDAG